MKALVLCGGGSLGAYEAGILKYFHERGTHFDIVTGTSIGSLNGAMFASGDLESMLNVWETVAADQVMANGINLYDTLAANIKETKPSKMMAFAKSYFKNSGADISPFIELVKKAVDPAKVKASSMKVGIVTTAYPSFKEVDVILNEVDENLILDYLHASSACWPIFPIYKIGKDRYVDGGYNNNLPIDLAIKMGATEIVAVKLKSFPPVPQHKELMDAPFVTSIESSVDIGGIMNFTHDVLMNNLNLGYLDAKKKFGEAIGYNYAFTDFGEYKNDASSFMAEVLSSDPLRWGKLESSMDYMGKRPHTSEEFYLRALESMGAVFDLSPYQEYTISSFMEGLFSKMEEYAKDPKNLESIQKAKFNRKLRGDEHKSFLAYTYDKLSKGEVASQDEYFHYYCPETYLWRCFLRKYIKNEK